MNNFEGEIERVYWTTAEVAKMLNVSIFIIHYWKKAFNIPSMRGLYSKEMVAQLHQIHNLLKVEKYTIPGAKLKLQNYAPQTNINQ